MGLFKLVWVSGNQKKAVKAAGKLTDQTELACAASETEYQRAISAAVAVAHIKDQAVLTGIAKDDKDCYMRAAAVKRITDQAFLTDIAKNAAEGFTRVSAAEKLTDQTVAQAVFVDVAKSDDWIGYRAAVKKITDQAALTDVAKSSGWFARDAAVEKITDRVLLTDVAKNAANSYTRIMAAEKLADQTVAQAVFSNVAKNDSNHVARCKAVEKITDQNVLADIFNNDENVKVRQAACGTIGHDCVSECICSRCGDDNENHDWVKTGEYIHPATDQILGIYRCTRCGKHKW